MRSAFDAELVLPDRSRSIAGGAVASMRALRPGSAHALQGALDEFLRRQRLDRETPLEQWPKAAARMLLEGDGGFVGLLARLDQVYAAARTDGQRTALEAFRAGTPCPSCGGAGSK